MGGAHRLGEPVIGRAAVLAGAAVALLCVCLVILSAGPSLRPLPPGEAVASLPAARSEDTPGTAAAPQEADAPADADGSVAGTSPSLDQAPEPGVDAEELQREEARAPLSELSLALPPQPPAKGEWKPTVLPRPVASAAGLIEARGYRIVLAGIEPIEASEECSFEGASWPCGIGARTAFRAFLRGRSVSCVVPPEPGSELMVAPCTIGKQDVAEWLVENGWARALPDGDYVALGETALEAGKGVFGRPPASSAPAPVGLDSALPRPPAVDGSILAPPSAEGVAPVGPQAGPLPMPSAGAFPMPPAPPQAPAQ